MGLAQLGIRCYREYGITGDDVSTPKVTCVCLMSYMRHPMSGLRDLVVSQKTGEAKQAFPDLVRWQRLIHILREKGMG